MRKIRNFHIHKTHWGQDSIKSFYEWYSVSCHVSLLSLVQASFDVITFNNRKEQNKNKRNALLKGELTPLSQRASKDGADMVKQEWVNLGIWISKLHIWYLCWFLNIRNKFRILNTRILYLVSYSEYIMHPTHQSIYNSILGSGRSCIRNETKNSIWNTV